MKLFLTSSGLDNENVVHSFRNNLFSKEMNDVSLLIVSIQDSDQDSFYLEKTIDDIKSTGINNINVFKLGSEKFLNDKKYDAVFVCGGNTFDYLDRMRKTGLDKFIYDFIKKKDSVYIGVSAGSIIAGPDIRIAGWGEGADDNKINLQDLRGLGLINFIIYPHYEDFLSSELKELRKKYVYPIIELKDGQAAIFDCQYKGD
jgi:dipeptidase E